MVVVSYSGKEINAKLVYYGAGLSGKTTNLEAIYEAVPDTSRGKMVSMKTQSDRTLFFDLLPLDLGEIMGFKTRFLLYTVPGQVFYNATRKLVLKGADAIVFVADSEVGKMEENKESLANLKANLAEYGLSLEEIPWVIQYNKRDLPNVYSVGELNAELNPGDRIPNFEAVATTGKGVFETFRGVSHLLMEKVTKDLRRTPFATAASRPAPAAEPAPARPEPSRSQAAAPVAPAWAIAREAQESPAPAIEAPATLDYGREISLPGESPQRVKAVAAAPSAAPSRPVQVPSGDNALPPQPKPVAVPRAAAPQAAVTTAAEPAMTTVESATAAVQSATAAAPAAPMTVPAAPQASTEQVVPVRVKVGAKQEIVLRIVLETES